MLRCQTPHLASAVFEHVFERSPWLEQVLMTKMKMGPTVVKCTCGTDTAVFKDGSYAVGWVPGRSSTSRRAKSSSDMTTYESPTGRRGRFTTATPKDSPAADA